MFEYSHGAGSTRDLVVYPAAVPPAPSLAAWHGDDHLGSVRVRACAGCARRPRQGDLRIAALLRGMVRAAAPADRRYRASPARLPLTMAALFAVTRLRDKG